MVELVAKNYARALFDLAIEEKKVEEIGEEVEAVAKILESDKSFYEFFITPLVAKKDKVDLIEKAFGGKISKHTENFFKVLIENGRGNEFLGISSQYKKMQLEYFNMIEAVAFTVLPITQLQHQKLVEKLEKETGKKVILKNTIDQSLLGGMLIKVGEQEIDGTVLNRLKNLQAAITK
ncbi:MAG: ATP synthase F1 subunit delta [Proteocatella sp.]